MASQTDSFYLNTLLCSEFVNDSLLPFDGGVVVIIIAVDSSDGITPFKEAIREVTSNEACSACYENIHSVFKVSVSLIPLSQ